MNKRNLLSVKKSLELLISSVEKREIEGFLALETIRGFRFLIYRELSGDDLDVFKKAVPYYDPTDMVSYEAEDVLEKAKYTASQLIIHIETKLDDWENKVEELSKNNKKLKKRIDELEKKQKVVLNELNTLKAEHIFEIPENKTKLLGSDDLLWLLEAVKSFRGGAFIASVAMCRVLFENLVNTECTKCNIDTSAGLQFKVEELKKAGFICGNHEKISELIKTFGDGASHPNIIKINKEKASFILNGCLILIDDLFKK